MALLEGKKKNREIFPTKLIPRAYPEKAPIHDPGLCGFTRLRTLRLAHLLRRLSGETFRRKCTFSPENNIRKSVTDAFLSKVKHISPEAS